MKKIISRRTGIFILIFTFILSVNGLCVQGADLTGLEGAMGYYDGINMSSRASAWELAAVTETPAVLVVDGRGRALSAAAEVRGFQSVRENSRISGVRYRRMVSR